MSFDALRYLASNPDLIAFFGLDTVAATNHYNTVGINEGRPIDFDALRYIASNPDLIAFFGLNPTAATTHYIANGFAEGRQVNFDALRYIASNPDLIAAFGTDTTAATQHYIGSGFSEGRRTTDFNAALATGLINPWLLPGQSQTAAAQALLDSTSAAGSTGAVVRRCRDASIGNPPLRTFRRRPRQNIGQRNQDWPLRCRHAGELGQ